MSLHQSLYCTADIEINYRPHYPGPTNFWTEVLPTLQQTDRPVYWFAGDVGSRPECPPVSMSFEGNVVLISNGVGSRVMDNVIVVNVERDGDVTFDLIHLNGDDPNGMGDLEDHVF